MAKFRIFNIQLLPNEDGIEEVGRAGYRKLFSKLNQLNAFHLRNKSQASFHFRLPGDTFFGPFDFHFPSGYVYGHFVRYTKTDKVVDLATDKALFINSGKKAAVTTKNKIPFVFDTDQHYLAIDGGSGSLPPTNVMIDALTAFLQPVADMEFPNHELTVNLISKRNALEQIFGKAVAYKVVDVNLTFPNGHATEELLRELKESKTQTLELHVSAGKKGRMATLPNFVKGLLRAATGLGYARLTYFVPDGTPDGSKREIFDSRDTPLTFTVKHSANDEGDERFFERVAEKLADIEVIDDLEEGADDDEDGEAPTSEEDPDPAA